MFLYNFIPIFIAILCLTGSSGIPQRRRIRKRHILNGRYTSSIRDYQLVVPRKLHSDGEFKSFKLPHFFKHEGKVPTRRKRSADDPDLIHYGVTLNNKDYHLELWPNRHFLDPNIVLEERDPRVQIKDRKLRTLVDKDICHYTGRVSGIPNSKVALSTCHGLAGYITIGNTRYFIEPVEDHQANSEGHHLHLIYDKHPKLDNPAMGTCGTSDDWEEAWKDRFREQLLSHSAPIKKRSNSVNRYLKTTVVCDKKFIEHNKKRDLDTLVMTLMNMVADFYHDQSVGHSMDVIVLRIIYLEKEEEEVSLKINNDATQTLDSFCNWQVGINPKDPSNPNHHDIAVLLTRWDICLKGECATQGLAWIGTVCSNHKNCGINEDMGLPVGIVTAHEMGHIMGCQHDKQVAKCDEQDTDGSYFVMSPGVHTHTIRWSPCSRAYITATFDHGLGECLNDEPDNLVHPMPNALPGTVYDGDAQCSMFFPNTKLCPTDESEFCDMLFCLKEGAGECNSNSHPPVDGTKCATNKWCIQTKCVSMGERPEAVNGGWGSWGDWSDCSRTCGGGISESTRECNNPEPANKGRYCEGERKKFKICNPIPCPANKPRFRDVQCAEFDGKSYNGIIAKWKPEFMADQPCALYCVNEFRQVAKMAPMVKNGTPCKPGTKNKCMAGVCRTVGCDNVIDSTAVEDVCGICNGDGTQCKIVDEVYKDGGRDYTKVTTIPAQARKVRIEEQAPSKNTIAITDKSGSKYYLNGNHQMARPGMYTLGEVESLYTHPEPQREVLTIEGPLKEELVFLVCFYEPGNVGFHYTYSEPASDVNYTPHYHWELLSWTECSANCGGGTQTSDYSCIEDKSGKVSPNFCLGDEKPEVKTKKCNEDPCSTKWRVGKWGTCHACKGKSGVRMRDVQCVQEAQKKGGEYVVLEDSKCDGAKPATRELCNANKHCRRSSGQLPDKQLRSVWSQIHRHRQSNKRQIDLDSLLTVLNNDTSTVCKNTSSNVTVDVGELIFDKTPEEEIKLIKVPIKQSQKSLNLSDNAFETIGDSVGARLDTGKAKIVTGKAAEKLLEEMEGKNETTPEKHKKSGRR